jgi:hypothetical protein
MIKEIKRMESKHIAWIIITIVVCITAGIMVSDLTKPKLTDPVAQRIWATTHGNSSLDGKDASKLIQAATYADSASRKK